MRRFIRFKTEKQQYNLLNCGQLDNWKDTCINRPTEFIDVCTDNDCQCDNIINKQ